MRRFALGVLVALALILCAPAARAQTYLPVPADSYGFCYNLAVPQTVSASCTVTVYDAGTSNISTIYSNDSGGSQINPFTATQAGTWRFYGTAGSSYDIRISGGLPAVVPYTITNVSPPGSFGSAPPYTIFGNCTASTAPPAFCSIVNAMLTPPGSDTQVISNGSGLYAASQDLTWNNSTKVFSVSVSNTPIVRLVNASGAGEVLFGSSTAPLFRDNSGTGWFFTSQNAQDIRIGPASDIDNVVIGAGGATGTPEGAIRIGVGAFPGTVFLNDTTSGAGVSLGPRIEAGNSAPETNVTGRIGSLFLRANGTATTSVYVKEAGTGNTGWQQFAMQDDVQMLTNKALSDGSTTVANTSDPTKKFAFNAAGITTGTTQTLASNATSARIATFPDASITVSGLTNYYCGTTTTCANGPVIAPHTIWGQVALSSGTPSTATVSSIAPAFTSTSNYQCSVTNMTTAADSLSVANTSTSSFTVTGPDTVTDVVSYICVGN